jgi:hypothetical protein
MKKNINKNSTPMFILENSIKENNKNSNHFLDNENFKENFNQDHIVKKSNKKEKDNDVDKDKLSESEYYNASTNKLDFLRNKYNSIPQTINQNSFSNSNSNRNINKINRFKIESAKKNQYNYQYQNDIENEDIQEDINEISDFIANDKADFSKKSNEYLIKLSRNETKNYIKNNKNFLNYLNNPYNNNIDLSKISKNNDFILPSTSEMLVISKNDSSKILNNLGNNYHKINNKQNSYQKLRDIERNKSNVKSRISNEDIYKDNIYGNKSINYNFNINDFAKNYENKSIKLIKGLKNYNYSNAVNYQMGK